MSDSGPPVTEQAEPTAQASAPGPGAPAESPSNDSPTITYANPSANLPFNPVGRMFGGYHLLAEIGRGGMGVVYKARQQALDRVVALKMILPGPLANPEELQRFRTEAEATARMQHPNIVTVHEVGAIDGQHFYSMDFIDGPGLNQRLASGPLPARTAARYVMTLARAVHHAHTHGVLHRDIKPSNILLDPDDQPHLTDFGLAKRFGGDSGHTHTGTVMGTPSYMAPEQAAGKVRALGPACDIYSLGAVLYELLTGRPPFRSETPLDTIKLVLEQDPVPPRLLNPKIERDLETICLKCLEKDPAARYTSALDLADDLHRYLNGETIRARSFSMIDRLARTLDRSQHVAEFRSWGTMLFIFAIIVFAGHATIFLLIQTAQPQPLHWLVRCLQFGLIGLVFWRYRSRTFLPTSSAERQLWSIWIGYLVAYLFTAAVIHLLVSQKVIARGSAGPDGWQELILYPIGAILTGLAFFVMGSNYWGRCYAFGLTFFGLAPLIALQPEYGPLLLGFLWTVTLVIIGSHVRAMGRENVYGEDSEILEPPPIPGHEEAATGQGQAG